MKVKYLYRHNETAEIYVGFENQKCNGMKISVLLNIRTLQFKYIEPKTVNDLYTEIDILEKIIYKGLHIGK